MAVGHGGGSWWRVMGNKADRRLGDLSDGPDHGYGEEGGGEDQQEEDQQGDLVQGLPLHVKMYFTGYRYMCIYSA